MRVKAEQTCEQIINYLLAEGFKFEVSKRDLEKAIMQHRGIDERTIERWIKALTTFEYLKPVSLKVYAFNPLKIPQVMKLLKEKPQTKLF